MWTSTFAHWKNTEQLHPSAFLFLFHFESLVLSLRFAAPAAFLLPSPTLPSAVGNYPSSESSWCYSSTIPFSLGPEEMCQPHSMGMLWKDPIHFPGKGSPVEKKSDWLSPRVMQDLWGWLPWQMQLGKTGFGIIQHSPLLNTRLSPSGAALQ